MKAVYVHSVLFKLRVLILLTKVLFENRKLSCWENVSYVHVLFVRGICARAKLSGKLLGPSWKNVMPCSLHLQSIVKVWGKLAGGGASWPECAGMNSSKWHRLIQNTHPLFHAPCTLAQGRSSRTPPLPRRALSCALTHISSFKSPREVCEINTISNSIYVMGKCRHREVKPHVPRTRARIDTHVAWLSGSSPLC